MAQQWLPGVEDWLDGRRGVPSKRRGRARTPDVDKLVAKAPARVQRLFAQLRDELVSQTGIVESVEFDDATGDFAPTYSFRNKELVRLHFDPVLAATVTLEAGDAQLAKLLQSPALSDKLKTDVVKRARRSGRRIFLALLARSKDDVADVVTVVREQVQGRGLTRQAKPA